MKPEINITPEENSSKKSERESLREFLTNNLGRLLITTVGILFALFVTGVAQPYVNTVLLWLFPLPHSIMIFAYNQSITPNHYFIAAYNQGNNSFKGLSFEVKLQNNNSQIKLVNTTLIGYSIFNYSPTGNPKIAYITLHPLAVGAWGVMEINLTNNSKLNLTINTKNINACSDIIYNLNQHVLNTTGIISGSNVVGNCGPKDNYNLILHSNYIKQQFIRPSIDCPNVVSGVSVLTNKINYTLSINSLESFQKLDYKVYINNTINNTLQTTISTNHLTQINISESAQFYLIEIYSPGNKNYTCSETLIPVSYHAK